MICMNTYVITRVIYVYPLYCPHGCVCTVLWTIHYAWPMTSPLQIIMIMHELQNELKTSVNWACRCSPCSCDVKVDNMIGGVASTQRKLSEKYLTCFALLGMGFMVVLMWADWYVLIWAFSAVLTEPVGCHFQTSLLLEQNLKNLINYFSVI